MGDLLSELERESALARRYCRRNFSVAATLFFIAVVSSGVAAVLASLGEATVPRVVTAVVAALPALIISLNSTLRFDHRHRWHMEREVALKGLLSRLRWEGAPESEISSEYRAMDQRLKEQWQPFGDLPVGPSGSNEARKAKV